MLGQSPPQGPSDLLKSLLSHQVNPHHPLYVLGYVIPWKKLEEIFAPLHGREGLPSHPLRRMAALGMLKYLYHLSDERVVAVWQENHYYQYFSGEATFQWGPPCAISALVHLRHCLREEGIAKLFARSVALHADKVKKAQEVIVDTSVQEKTIPLPTDAQLDKQVMKRCNVLAKNCGMKPRDQWMVRRLDYAQGDAHLVRHAQRTLSKLLPLAGRQVREPPSQLSSGAKGWLYVPI
jgi:transposase, IS5 family